jgi:hypothetical protein
MKRLLMTTFLVAVTPVSTLPIVGAMAQTAVGIGTGVATSRSDSKSQAVAISGQGGNGGNPTAVVNVAANPASTVATVNNTGTSTIRNVPSVFSPGLAAAGLETCLGSVSGGGSFVGTGFSFGSTIPDPGCAARLDARTLWSMGLKKAAVARLCLQGEIARSMPEVCVHYLPQPQPVAYAVAPVGELQYVGGQIWLVEGTTGQDRLCNDYDVTGQRCRAWAHVHHAARKPRGVIPAATAPAESGNKEEVR